MQTPGVLTVDDIFMKFLGLGGSPLGQFVAPMLKPMMYQALGLESQGQRDALLDFVVSTNMTQFGTALELRNRQYNRIASANVDRMKQAKLNSWLLDFRKSTMSYNSWKAAKIAEGYKGDLSDAAYQRAMRDDAAGLATNPAWAMLYQGFDPDGIYAASENLQLASANLARNASLRGQRNAFAQARALNKFFADGKFNTADYGFMGIGEVSAVAAALTRDIDFFGDASGPGGMKRATKRLSEKLQEYTQALAPLKDVFGKDVPAMIKAVEELSGRRFTNIGAGSINSLVRQVLDGATAGNYTLQQVVDTGSAWRSALLQMNVPFLNDLSSVGVAQSVLNSTAPAGAAPRYMSQARWEKMAGDHITRASVSRGGEMFAQAYAILLQRNPNLTFEEFMARYNNSYRTSVAGTLYAMTGAHNAADLERQAGASGMLPQAYEQNINTKASLEMGARVSRTRLRDRLRAQGYGSGAIEEALNFFTSSSNMDFEAVANSGLSAGGRAVANTLLSLDKYQNDMTNLRTLYTNQEASRRAERVAKARAAAEQINSLAPDSLSTAVRAFLSGDLTWSSLKASNKALLAVSNPEAMEDTRAVAQAAGIIAKEYGLSGDDAQAFAESAVRFRFSDGIASEKYLEWQDKYKRARTPAQRKLAAQNMLLYQYGDQERLSSYWKRHKATNGQELRGKLAEFLKLKDAGAIRAEMSDYMIGDELKAAVLKDDTLSTEAKNSILANIDKATAESGMMTSSDWTDALTKGANGAKLADVDQANKLKEEVGIQQQSLESLLTDKFDILGGLVKAIEDLVTELRAGNTGKKGGSSNETVPQGVNPGGN